MFTRFGVCVAIAMVGCGDYTGLEEDPEGNVAAVFPDEDGDGILDHHEGSVELVDWDEDGEPDFQDLDSDNDTIPDAIEAGDEEPLTFPVDTDFDTIPDYRDLDSDDNCLLDQDEGAEDTDGDGYVDSADVDNDGDGIKDTIEIQDTEACAPVDSDGDGVADYMDEDSDGDGVGDFYEAGTSEFDDRPNDTDGDGTPDYLDDDSDGDGFSDAEEAGVSSPGEEPRDSDGDGVYDFADTDSDNDGLSDAEERDVYGTDPYDSDSDGDGFSDGAEIATDSDPLDGDAVIEGLYIEVPERADVEEQFNFELSIQLGDIAFLLDTTGSMGSTVTAMKSEYGAIVDRLSTVIPDANYAVATFDDYNYGGMGSGQDRPFILKQQVTSDVGRVQSALTSISLHGGADWAESSVEAIYQTLTGTGYDQNCNGRFDSGADVRPFRASASDPFGGTGGAHDDSSVPGAGSVGGVGFRPYALPVVVYATDATMRDAATMSTPGGCPGDAAGPATAVAANYIGAYLIAVACNRTDTVGQMNLLSDATNSYADLDGDGAVDDRLVFQWSGSSAAFRNTIVDAIEQTVQSVAFDEIRLEIEGDDRGFVVDIDPAVYPVAGAVSGSLIDFTLTFRGTVAATGSDQLFQLTLNVVGDGAVLLDTLDIFVLVPGV
jgi:hypothetical protein